MKTSFNLFAMILFALSAAFMANAATTVQALTVGDNVLIGGPGKALHIEAVGDSASGTITVKRVIDQLAYSTSAATITNSFTNTVSWSSETVTNNVISWVDDFVTITNAVYTNVVLDVTNVVYDTTRYNNGSHPVTNSVVITRPVWTTSSAPFRTSTVTNDVLTLTPHTNTVGTITLANHVGTLAPSNLYFTAGDVLVIESANQAILRLYSEED